MNSTASKVCSGCKNPIGNKLFLDCSGCKDRYDLVCVNVTDQCFRRMEKEHAKETWMCPECLSKMPKTDNQNSPLRSAPVTVPLPGSSTAGTTGKNSAKTSASVAHLDNVTRRKKVITTSGCLVNNEETPNSTENIQQQVLECFKSTMEAYVVTALDEFADKFFSRFDKLAATMEVISVRLASFDERISSLEARLGQERGAEPVQSHLISEIEQLKCELNERDQELLINDLEISGIPETNNENMLHLVTVLSKKVGVTVSELDVVSVMRVGPRRATSNIAAAVNEAITTKDSGPSIPPATEENVTKDDGSRSPEVTDAPILYTTRPLVVRLVRRAKRDELLRAARVRRVVDTSGLGLPGETRRVYVNERLTPTNRRLFYKTRLEARQQQWRAPWTSRGSIFVRRDADHSPQKIRSEADLSRVFGKQ